MKLIDGLVWEFKGRHVVRKEGEIVLAGANPSAEGEDADEGTDEHVERGIDFVLNHRLIVRPFFFCIYILKVLSYWLNSLGWLVAPDKYATELFGERGAGELPTSLGFLNKFIPAGNRTQHRRFELSIPQSHSIFIVYSSSNSSHH
ncbi:unnamed protein product [Dracunculus medinensis]|uniref:Translationally-controlled tumor protein homolog n=1 Tax=Dracunculus medinensis TaxID=318479 RepID=A0A0N4UCD0_DRAME|nr:unnamed protein product [Dracunculus medinensis]